VPTKEAGTPAKSILRAKREELYPELTWKLSCGYSRCAMAKRSGGAERLMTLQELAVYLHMGEATVLKLAAGNKLPGSLIDGQWRFRRAVVDEWLEKQIGVDAEEAADAPDGLKVPLGELLVGSGIISDLRGKDGLGVIEELAARAYSQHWLKDKPWFIGAVVEREALASTAMEGGVAFLHTRARDTGRIGRPFIVFGRSYAGIDFGAPDGQLTYLFFLLGLKYDRLHLPILGRLARMLRRPDVVAKLRATTSPEVMRNTLLREDAALLSGAAPPTFAAPPPKQPLSLDVRKRAIMRVAERRKTQPVAPVEPAPERAAAPAPRRAGKPAAKAKPPAASPRRRGGA
jgi:excisionase family DNA binding protein